MAPAEFSTGNMTGAYARVMHDHRDGNWSKSKDGDWPIAEEIIKDRPDYAEWASFVKAANRQNKDYQGKRESASQQQGGKKARPNKNALRRI